MKTGRRYPISLSDMDYKKGAFTRNIEELLKKMAEDLEKKVAEDPSNEDLLYKLGTVYLRLGKNEKAREIYLKLRDINNSLARDLLDRLYEI